MIAEGRHSDGSSLELTPNKVLNFFGQKSIYNVTLHDSVGQKEGPPPWDRSGSPHVGILTRQQSQCPLWVISRHSSQQNSCRFTPPQKKRTLAHAKEKSAKGQLRNPIRSRTVWGRDGSSRIWPGYRSNRIISHRRAIFFLPYEPAPNQRTAQTVGLLSIQEPIDLGGPYSRVRPDQRKHLF